MHRLTIGIGDDTSAKVTACGGLKPTFMDASEARIEVAKDEVDKPIRVDGSNACDPAIRAVDAEVRGGVSSAS